MGHASVTPADKTRHAFRRVTRVKEAGVRPKHVKVRADRTPCLWKRTTKVKSNEDIMNITELDGPSGSYYDTGKG